jgi:hypothetical protein
MPPNPTVAMFTVSLGAWKPRPSTCRGRSVTPAPTAVVVRNVRLEMSLMESPAENGFYRADRAGFGQSREIVRFAGSNLVRRPVSYDSVAMMLAMAC